MKQKEEALTAMPMENFLRRYLFWPWDTLKDVRWKLGGFWQRGRRGWADSDAWYMDIYLTKVISEMLTFLANNHYGVPFPFSADEENLDEADARWTAWLCTMAQAFTDYETYMNSDQAFEDIGNVFYKEHIERMRHLFDHWAQLGD